MLILLRVKEEKKVTKTRQWLFSWGFTCWKKKKSYKKKQAILLGVNGKTYKETIKRFFARLTRKFNIWVGRLTRKFNIWVGTTQQDGERVF